jgi:tetratricopeptide (TPR) repeat protein
MAAQESPAPSPLDLAVQALRSRQPRRAEALARQALDAAPDDPRVWEALGDAAAAQGRPAEAAAAFALTVEAVPGDWPARVKLANALLDAGDRRAAIPHLRQALALGASNADTMLTLGVALAQEGQLREALMHLRQAAVLAPESAAIHHNLGVALADAGEQAEAEKALRQALRLDPAYGEAHANLGKVLDDQGRQEEAAESYRQAIRHRPTLPSAYAGLAHVLGKAGRRGEAVVLLEQAQRLEDKSPHALNRLGLALAEAGRFAEAEGCYLAALRISPLMGDLHVNLASARKEMGRLEEAAAGYEMAVALDPSAQSARYNRALALLQAGRWEEGWKEYEHRWGRKRHPPRPFAQPRWDGTPMPQGTLLAWMEQGTGDMIHFVRFAGQARQRVGKVVVECPASLVPLFATCPGVDQVVAEGGELPPFDAQVPLMSLPGILGVRPDGEPGGPYLQADPARVAKWREVLGGPRGLRVGIVWQGNPAFQWDHWRSAPLRAFAPLSAVPGVELVSLQKGPGEEQLARAGFPVRRLEGLDEGGEAFADTAAVLRCLDLVVCVDTAVGHVAGALGVPAWLALSAVCDWRWLREGGRTVWYAGHRLFRQASLDAWDGVFARMAEELEKLAKARAGGAGTALARLSAGEILDRVAILRLKAEKLAGHERAAQVAADLAEMEAARTSLAGLDAVAEEETGLAEVNRDLWEVEDRLRDAERGGAGDAEVARLSREVMRLNGRRGQLKAEISRKLGSPWGEVKQYGTQGA